MNNNFKIISISLAILFVSSVLMPIEDAYATTTFVDSIDTNADDNNPSGLAFNTDGTKMYFVGDDSLEVIEFNCTTGFDLSTCTDAGSPKDISGETTTPEGLAFNTDGTKMFLAETDSGEIIEYNCTDFDVSTCTDAGSLKDVSGEDALPRGVAFNTDGTKMFFPGDDGNDINEYGCTAFDVSTCTFTVKAGNPFSVATQTTSPAGLAFSTDGTKMFVIGEGDGEVNQYTLTTGFDVSTASFDNVFSTTAQDSSPGAIAFSANGLTMIIGGSGGASPGDLYEYTLEITFDLFASPSSTNTNSGGGGFRGDAFPPTLGIDRNGIRLVEDGFTYNGKSIDVERYFTPYPLITVQVGVPNKAVFKIYEGGKPGDVRHFELAFGLANGARIDTTDAAIVWDRTFAGIETVTLIDPENVLENVRVETSEGKCREASAKNDCLIVTIDHTFRAPLDYNMIGSYVWDEKRNGWQNYYNEGIAIEGESLNPPKQYQVAHMGHFITITETGKNKAVDENGNTWTFDGTTRSSNTWKMDYIVNIVKDGFWKVMDRNHSEFSKYKQDQVDIANSKLLTLCPDCFVESFEEINNIKFYEFPELMNKLDDPEIQRIAAYEEIRAMKILQQIMDPSSINYN